MKKVLLIVVLTFMTGQATASPTVFMWFGYLMYAAINDFKIDSYGVFVDDWMKKD